MQTDSQNSNFDFELRTLHDYLACLDGLTPRFTLTPASLRLSREPCNSNMLSLFYGM